MKVFVLEDDPARVQWLRERLIDHDLTVIDSCADVKQFQPPYDLLLLDHDLGGRQMEDHEDCGETFAWLIREHVGDADVIVHSYNWPGAMAMLAALGKGVYAPFRGPYFTRLLAEAETGHALEEV